MRLYLFANEKYGLPLVEAAARIAQAGGPRFTVVLSGRANHREPLVMAGWPAVKRRLKCLWLGIRRSRRWRLPVHVAIDVNDDAFFRCIRPNDVGIVCGFNQIFKRRCIERFDRIYNFHPSILPYYRGPVPSYWCLQNGETATGFTLHEVTERIDVGEILYQERIDIPADSNVKVVDAAIAQAVVPVLDKFTANLVAGKPWEKVCIDADTVYNVHLDYASFPE